MPLTSGQKFQEECNWNLDNRYPRRLPHLPHNVKLGDKVFMKVCDIGTFLSLVKHFPVPIDAVIHNSDESFTDEMYNALSPFCRNVYAVNCVTNLATPIPLGFRDHQYTSHHVMTSIKNEPQPPRTILCLINFLIATNIFVRQAVFDKFSVNSWCTTQDYVTYDYRKSLTHSDSTTARKRVDYYRTLKATKFAICPAGTGLDTHRVYECILFGVTPIVMTSPLDRLYKDYPVWIVSSWDEITEEKLLSHSFM